MHKFIAFVGNCLRWLFFVVLCIPSFSTVVAHEIRPAIVDLNYANNSEGMGADLYIDVSLNLESLIAGISPEHDNTDESDNSDIYQNLRGLQQGELLAEFVLFKPRFLSSILVTHSKTEVLPLEVASIEIPDVGDTSIPRDSLIKLSASLPDGVSDLYWQWSEAFGEAIVRGNSNVQDMDFAVLLSPGQQSELISFERASTHSTGSTVLNYIVVGFEHILPKGLDHILFVVGLFLLAPKWRPLLVQITTFTIAHSITLALGATGLLVVLPSIVEPLIALSIVFVCVENFLTARLNKWRIATVFCFGLLHGLGFASVLGEVGLGTGSFVAALFGFNVGVELGQLFVVGVCLLAVGLWFGKKPWYRARISIPASIVVGLIGAYWFLERTVLA